MPSHEVLALLATACTFPRCGAVTAYVGLGPGQEFIPYFFALLALLVTAFAAIIRYPFYVLARFLGFQRDRREGETNRSIVVTVPESAGEGRDANP